MRYSLHKQAHASLNSGINLRDVVRLPEGETMNDWLVTLEKLYVFLQVSLSSLPFL